MAEPRGSGTPFPQRRCASQMEALSAATAKALTTVFAGFALTFTSFPNITLLPALVAAFFFVLTMHTPGITNFPALFTCFVATAARTSMTLEHSDFLRPDSPASASAIAPFVMLLTAFMAFIAFMAFMGAMLISDGEKT